MTQVACAPGQQPVAVTGGQTYYFMAVSFGPATFTLNVQVAVPPANDLIENATVIHTLPFSATQSTQDASASPSDPPASCLGGTFGTVWFRYDAAREPAAARE